ncbi:MAG: hypothetical protein ACLP7P_05000 [Rhodomicrobium sp.]
MNRYPLFFLLFSLTLVAFAVVDVRYLGLVFNQAVRWVFLVLLFAFLLWRGSLGRGLQGGVGALILMYTCWIIATVFWSEVPALSLPKAFVNAIVVLTCVSAGFTWANAMAPNHSLTVYASISAVTVISGVAGVTVPEATMDTGSVVLYSGLAYNPNLLGILIIMSMPWALWFYDESRNKPLRRRILAFFCLALLLATLLFTGARSSILSVGVVVLVYLLYAGFGRSLAILAVGVSALLVFPSLIDWAWSLIQKGQQESGDILYSRREVWEASLAGAEQGGMFGVGYGVSAGEHVFEGGFSAIGYGREKGNSALAVIEELGQIGFVLYVLLMLGLLWRLISAAHVAPSRAMRIQIALVLGTLLALIISSQFEAWWTAPGSPPSPFFWALSGSGIALSSIAQRAARDRLRAAAQAKTDLWRRYVRH